MRACCSERSQIFPFAEVALYFQELLVVLLKDEHIDSQVLEVPRKRPCSIFSVIRSAEKLLQLLEAPHLTCKAALFEAGVTNPIKGLSGMVLPPRCDLALRGRIIEPIPISKCNFCPLRFYCLTSLSLDADLPSLDFQGDICRDLDDPRCHNLLHGNKSLPTRALLGRNLAGMKAPSII